MSDINYLLLLTGRKPLKGAVKCNNVDELYSEVVKKHAARFETQGINVEPAELIAYSVLSNDYDDYSADRRQFTPGALNPLRPAKKLIDEECIVLIGSSSQVGLVESNTTTLFIVGMWGDPNTKYRIQSCISLDSLRKQITSTLWQDNSPAGLFSLYYILDVNDPYITRVWIGDDQELKNYLIFRASRPSNNHLFLHIDTIPHPDNPLKPRSPVRPPTILTNFPRSSGNSPIILSPKTDGSSPRTAVSSPKTNSSPLSPPPRSPVPTIIPVMSYIPQHAPIKDSDIISLEQTVKCPTIFRAWDGSRAPISDVAMDLTTFVVGGSIMVKAPGLYWAGVSFYASIADLKKNYKGKLSFVCKADTRALLEASPDLQLIRDSRDPAHIGLAPTRDIEISEFEGQLSRLFESKVFIADIVASTNSPSSTSSIN